MLGDEEYKAGLRIKTEKNNVLQGVIWLTWKSHNLRQGYP